MTVTFGGCTKSKDPKESFNQYISYLQKSDYPSMYTLLSSDSKKKVDEKYFVDRYKNAYEGARVSKVSVDPQFPEKFKEDNGKIHFPAEITLETPLGIKKFTYDITMINEKQGKNKEWFVDWNEKMILPELEKGDKVAFERKLGKRGEIKDRNGNGLAVNTEAVSVYVVPDKIQYDRANIVAKLADSLGATAEEIEGKLNEPYAKAHPDQRVRIMTLSKQYDIERARKAIKVEQSISAPTETFTIRYYPTKDAAAQLIGYVDNITVEELQKYKAQGYDATDIIGKTGLEYTYEKRLRGEIGGTLYTTDDKGKKKSVILDKPVKDGEDITLTIDTNLQKTIYGQLAGDKGAAVAVHPKTGEVLAMVSTPSYDPNVLVSEISTRNLLALQNDTSNTPLVARFAAAIVPGSTFKPITAAIGLKTGKLDPSKELNIVGSEWQKDASWSTYKVKRVHADDTSVNLMDALVTSDNIYFARTALDIGKDNFLNGTKEFGIGEKMIFPYAMAASQTGALDKDIELADSGYGQGKVLMNPLHMALIYSSFINEGNILSPIIEMKDRTDSPKVWKEKAFSKEIADTITNDLIQVVERGTGKDGRIQGVAVAGKTGTAEVDKTQQNVQGKENGWFAAYNTSDPKLAVVMMIEDVGEKGGSGYVVPKVRNVMKSYFNK